MVYNIPPPPLTRRIDLNVGYSCNIKCGFCYYLTDVKARNRDKDLTTEECRDLIARHYARGLRVLEFTGGEPTIRRDLFELARFAKTAGFSRVSVITNGLRLADNGYARELVSSGVEDFLFSVHGSTAGLHDSVTNVPGSFDRLMTAVRNVQALRVKVRCNSVITGTSLADVYNRARLFRDMGIKTVNFILFNPIQQQTSGADERNFLRYADAAAELKRTIAEFGPAFDKFTVRYLPLCLMPGLEKHVQNVPQVHYDHDEWDYYYRSRTREPLWKWLGGLLAGAAALPDKRLWLSYGWDHFRHAAILQAHTLLHKRKFSKCRRCAYGRICGGVWNEYARRFGDLELTPAPGPAIAEPWHFMDDAQRAETRL